MKKFLMITFLSVFSNVIFANGPIYYEFIFQEDFFENCRNLKFYLKANRDSINVRSSGAYDPSLKGLTLLQFAEKIDKCVIEVQTAEVEIKAINAAIAAEEVAKDAGEEVGGNFYDCLISLNPEASEKMTNIITGLSAIIRSDSLRKLALVKSCKSIKDHNEITRATQDSVKILIEQDYWLKQIF